MNEKRWLKNWWLWRGFDKPSLWFPKRRWFRIITNRCSTPGSGMISTTRGAKQPLILTIVYGRNESSRRNYSRRATNSDEMIMIIGCHKFPVSFSTRSLSSPRLATTPRCTTLSPMWPHTSDRSCKLLQLSLPLARFPVSGRRRFLSLAKLLSFVESLITAFSSFATCRAANRPIK